MRYEGFRLQEAGIRGRCLAFSMQFRVLLTQYRSIFVPVFFRRILFLFNYFRISIKYTFPELFRSLLNNLSEKIKKVYRVIITALVTNIFYGIIFILQ